MVDITRLGDSALWWILGKPHPFDDCETANNHIGTWSCLINEHERINLK